MLDLQANDEETLSTHSMPAHSGMDTLQPPGGYPAGTEVRICINDVTLDASQDFTGDEDASGDNELTIEQLKKAQRRRSSWCPEENKKKEERKEKQRTLAVSGRR